MSPKEFIINQIDALLKDFPSVEFGYKYDTKTETHLVSVLPLDLYTNSTEYKESEYDVITAFYENFPGESIHFVSTESYCWFEDAETKRSNVLFDTPYEPDLGISFSIDLCVEPGCQMYTVPCLGNNYSIAA